ncbi:DsbA family oxidoreductase [Gordonia sp. PP30]|uniref:DsbA family oxidoreductase n=1 Tax=unclassified Gordonia (in: high G+C Gram-positive bacteria) TaxID=2657482 RepID=UPI001FFF81C4|nr:MULTISPECIES: DsbA family oxidoreductase [unclassified Gordonia (in: high G+C Gram-positive bacteria)]UQE76027.1 DsbA family oxidoreductase [Gordonia sp. PP30]
MKVEIWSDINCPFCYLGVHQFLEALGGFEHKDQTEVIHRSFELDPTQPRGASGEVVAHLAKQYGFTREQASQGEIQLGEKAAEFGLPYVTSGRDFGDSFDMHRLVHFAGESGRAEDMLLALFHANFADERKLFGSHERLVEIAVGEGFDEAQVRAVLADDTRFAQAVRDDETLAHELKCQGVPYFVLDRHYVLSGAQPVEVYADFLRQGWEHYISGATST